MVDDNTFLRVISLENINSRDNGLFSALMGAILERFLLKT